MLPDKRSWGVFSCICSAGNCQQQTKWVAAIYSLPKVCHHTIHFGGQQTDKRESHQNFVKNTILP
jgi:hypothetical protein